MRVGFEVVSVQRDGADEPWKAERQGNGVRVYMGDADTHVPPGEHVYAIRYRTTRQLGFFDDYDELYWNATGNGWVFPIDVAEARIRLPRPVPFGQRAVYTGPQGSTDCNAEVVSEAPGDISFRTTDPLGAAEGLTVAVAWEKGVVAPPPPPSAAGLWLQDNGPPAAGVLALLGGARLLFPRLAPRRPRSEARHDRPHLHARPTGFPRPPCATSPRWAPTAAPSPPRWSSSESAATSGSTEEEGGFFRRDKTRIDRTPGPDDARRSRRPR